MSKKRRFTARLETVQRDLMRVIRAMQATSLHVNQDILEGTAEIVFDREGQRYPQDYKPIALRVSLRAPLRQVPGPPGQSTGGPVGYHLYLARD